MRICHLLYDDLENPWLAGGGAVRIREVYRRLADRHQITVISGPFPGAEPEKEVDGVRHVRVGSANTYARSRIAYCRHAMAELRTRRWDLWINEFSAYAPLRVPSALRHRGILLMQNLLGRDAVRHRRLVGPLAVAIGRRAIRMYPNILAISTNLQTQILDAQREAPDAVLGERVPNGVELIPNGVGEEWFAEPGVEEPYILFFGRIDVYQKGLDTLLPAFARVAADRPDIELRLAGGGHPKQVEWVRNVINQLGLTRRVRLLGRCSSHELAELARSALFVCMPSRFEGQGIVALEAAASGKAVLATNVGGLNEAVIDDETGMLVPPNDSEALTRGMLRLLDEPGLRQRLGARGRARVRAEFSWTDVANRVEDAYKRVLDALPSAAP